MFLHSIHIRTHFYPEFENATFSNIFQNVDIDKELRIAKNCKIPVQKRPNYIIKSNLKFGIIFLKSWTLVSNYIAKLSTKVNPYYESIENFGITLLDIEKLGKKIEL